jgi:hypothetical protein
MIIFGINFRTLNWGFILYTVVAIVGLVYGTKTVYEINETRGVVFAICAFFVLMYYGGRWFGVSKLSTSKNWPPVINMCPDYLTYVKRISGCVDMTGITSKSAGLIKTLPSEVATVQRTNSQKVFEFTSEDVRDAKNVDTLTKICDRCQTAGVTWEGVWDGDVCVGISKHEGDAARKERCVASV